MKVFLSHSSMNKSNVKAIVAYLPKQIQVWLDESNLIWGSALEETFETVIKTEIDYVIVFLSGVRSANKWVVKELNWAIEHQKKIGRTFVLPVIMPGVMGDPYLEYPEISDIKYIMLDNYEEIGFKSCAEKITTQLFTLIINDLENMHKPKKENLGKALTQANSFIEDLCRKVYSVVFKHRSQNPITVEELFDQLNRTLPDYLSEDDFPDLLNRVCSMLSGVYYDGYQLFLIEEHAQWKKDVGKEKKRDIAYTAMRYIRNGQSVYIDAGSTMMELVNILCKRIESRTLSGNKIIAVSTEHASRIADTCAKLGYDQHTAPITLYVPGGMVRPNTKAIVGIDAEDDIARMANSIGKFDIAFVGANGATADDGIYTHENEELIVKRSVIQNSKQVYFVFDDSKCGLVLESKLADFSDSNAKVIINENPDNAELMRIVERYPGKVQLAKPVKR